MARGNEPLLTRRSPRTEDRLGVVSPGAVDLVVIVGVSGQRRTRNRIGSFRQTNPGSEDVGVIRAGILGRWVGAGTLRGGPVGVGEGGLAMVWVPCLVSQRLGHASIRTTYDIYRHLFEGRDRQAADVLEAARTRSLADSPRTLRRPDGPSLEL